MDFSTIIPGKRKTTARGWISFNAPCCHHRGHKPDRRMRGGMKSSGHEMVYHCFNCGFKCGFTLGKPLTANTKKFMIWCGVGEDVIAKWNLESIQSKDILEHLLPAKPKINKKIKFDTVSLPENAIRLDMTNPEHERYILYLNGRGIDLDDYPFYVTPNDTMPRYQHRIIIPHYDKKQNTIGYIEHYIDKKIPKYIKHHLQDPLFGHHLQDPNWQVCLVFEGIFDAIPLNGCAVLHDTISDIQAQQLYALRRKIIVVPDQDKTGLNIIDRALELGFHVSLPKWGNNIKDTNDAIVRYGRLPTLLSILQAATNSTIKLQLARNRIVKGL